MWIHVFSIGELSLLRCAAVGWLMGDPDGRPRSASGGWEQERHGWNFRFFTFFEELMCMTTRVWQSHLQSELQLPEVWYTSPDRAVYWAADPADGRYRCRGPPCDCVRVLRLTIGDPGRVKKFQNPIKRIKNNKTIESKIILIPLSSTTVSSPICQERNSEL